MFDEILGRSARTSPGVELTFGYAAKPEPWAESVSRIDLFYSDVVTMKREV